MLRKLNEIKSNLLNKDNEKQSSLNFKITEIKTDRSLDGETAIRAICTDDNQEVEIRMFNKEVSNKELMKVLMVVAYNRIQKTKSTINVGDII